jgi:RIO kinase 1
MLRRCSATSFAARQRPPFLDKTKNNEIMRIPSSLTSLVDEGVIEEVVRPLLSGKEAEVFLVLAGGALRVAKVYKEAHNRTFKNRAEYTEGRKVRNSRDQRAMQKRSSYGRAQDESSWRTTEVDMIYRLHSAGVRVPTPYNFIDGVLVMEMIADAEGNPAPRLAEVSLDRDEAAKVFDRLMAEVVRMLCAGVVHGDLSDFNVLMAADGPVLIDFPQSVDAAGNQNARRLLLRDVANLERFLSRFVPGQRPRAFAEEMWDLYARSLLTPETRLTGRHRATERQANTAAVLDLIGDANYDERKRRERQGMGMRGVPAATRPAAPAHAGNRREPRPQHPQSPAPRPPQHAHGSGPRQHGRPQQPAHGAASRPPHEAIAPAHRPEPAEPAAPPPRRRVVISVDNNRRRPGPRRKH